MPAAAVILPRLLQAARGGPEATLDVAARELRVLGFDERRTRAAPSAAFFSRGRSRVALSGHVDVVPAGPGWARDPFGGEVAEGRVWGRGACDMLGSVACFVEAASRSRAPCAVLLTTDEETGMKAAEVALAEGLLAGIEAVVVGEPTAMAVGVAEKGVLWMRVECFGRTAHGSMPELGDNAVLRATRVAARLADARLAGEHALLGRATLSVNRIGGGEAVNQVPAEAFLEADARYLPGASERDVLALVERALAPEAGQARVRVLSSHAPFEIDPSAPLARAALAAVARAGQQARAVGLPYGTEASKFAPAGIPTVILGPGEPGFAHSDHESIALFELRAGADAYVALLEACA